jgi:DNA-directed RNA polymerase specialized sigma24 family protein
MNDMTAAQRQLAQVLEEIRQDPALPERLPETDAAIVKAALDGEAVDEIAQRHHLPEDAVWEVLDSAARSVTEVTKLASLPESRPPEPDEP